MRTINLLRIMMRLHSRTHLITTACIGRGYDQKRGLLQYQFIKQLGAAYGDESNSLLIPEENKPTL
ncbi:gp020 [Erwinia phage vB_EamP-S6]|uniref:Gp020 n=1 Tax=Erwinia phage vB_EamP-S6 TaxID=1051675 RepID=G0YQB2_9CAUD|nr:gp020 [Erwinia phage vB_EamP-S6]AEJ81539.1 gp020 [Erwinia phage vB_EamP-S6]